LKPKPVPKDEPKAGIGEDIGENQRANPSRAGASSSSSSSSSKTKDSAAKAAKPRDPNLDHEAVVLYREVCHLTPNHAQRKMIVEAVTDLDAYRAVLTKFMQEGQPPNHVDWTLERYSDHRPTTSRKLTTEERQVREAELMRKGGWDKLEQRTA
jgi:hypothetical protein